MTQASRSDGLLRVGIDVGGTNTDAVVMRGREVLQGLKRPTTADVMSGVAASLCDVVEAAGVLRSSIAAVMIGTTHFTNALVERRHLAPVGLIRLGLPATRGVPPTSGWPADMAAALNLQWRLARGGYEFDGREIAAIDTSAIKEIAGEFAAQGIFDVAVSGVFSFMNDAQERAVEALLQGVVPKIRVTLASQIGHVGLLERENAAVLNASLGPLGLRVVEAFKEALRGAGVNAPLYLTQNDGTLMSAAQAIRFPILTVASGPTNSMRGAAFLSDLRDAIVIDIGGTTSDVGVLQAGFPRQSGVAVEVGGVRTNFRMPDVHSIGLGGGSMVSSDLTSIGPRSVGYAIQKEARVFGGTTLTATDIAVAAGVTAIGDAGAVADLNSNEVARCHDHLQAMLVAAVERMRTSAQVLPLVVVGGGSILLRDQLDGTPVIVPPHFGVANAVGAAMAQVSGEVARVVKLEGTTREVAIAALRAEAERKAVAAGADAGSLQTVDVEDVPLAYLGAGTTRIRVRVVGDLSAAGYRDSAVGGTTA